MHEVIFRSEVQRKHFFCIYRSQITAIFILVETESQLDIQTEFFFFLFQKFTALKQRYLLMEKKKTCAKAATVL